MRALLPDKLRGMTPYEPIAGDFPVRLDANESFLSFSQAWCAEAIQNVSPNRYPDPYCAGLCRKFSAFYGVDEASVVMGNGSDELISILIGSLLSKGDAVVLSEMDFSMYRFYADLYECRSVPVPKAADLQTDVDAMIDAAQREHARMVIFSNPCNPTSLLLPHDAVARLVDALDCIVVVDEAYMEFAGAHSVMAMTQTHPHLIVLKTFSKAFGLAAIRLGAAISGQILINAVKAAKSPYNVNALSQAIGEAALSDASILSRNVQTILAERDFLLRSVRALAQNSPRILAVYESAANFICMRVSGALEMFEGLKGNGVIVRRFGEYLRVTAGTREENECFLQIFRLLLE